MQPDFAQDPDELFDVVNEDGSPTGIVKRRADVHRDGDWHRAIHVWVYGVEPEPFLLLNLRSLDKDTWPGRLDVTVGGHLAAGETTDEAFREIEEEIGIVVAPSQVQFLQTRQARGLVERELQEVFLCHDDRPLGAYRPNPAELEGLVLITLENALAVFGEVADSAEATILHARTGEIAPFVVDSTTLLPSRYFPYYLSIARAAARLIRGEAT